MKEEAKVCGVTVCAVSARARTHERTRMPHVCTHGGTARARARTHMEPRGSAAGPPSQGDSLAVQECSVLNHYALANHRRNAGHTSAQIVLGRYRPGI